MILTRFQKKKCPKEGQRMPKSSSTSVKSVLKNIFTKESEMEKLKKVVEELTRKGFEERWTTFEPRIYETKCHV